MSQGFALGTPTVPLPVSVANGGTNANSFGTSNGIVVYDGTKLVTYSGPQINSSGYETNSTQPGFYAYLNSTVTSVTGDGTAYVPIYGSTLYNVASCYNTSTGVFTAPILGYYLFNAMALFSSLGASHNLGFLEFYFNGASIGTGSYYNVGAMRDGGNNCSVNSSIIFYMANTDTMSVRVAVSGSTKTVGVFGSGTRYSYFCGRLLS